MFTPDEQYLLREKARDVCTTSYRDRVLQSLMLRTARDADERAFLLRTLADARESWRIRTILTQRRWQASVSRRPARGRHHDSWAIRENYIRCAPNGSYRDYLEVAAELGAPARA